ncbi:hypothetical protein A2160_00670 [Candidatus Beckwithbacteria bacterium RBG_13_42_9]|uniref:Secondary thiamine-phosphate synthase enzyme n=1 Tax=Candidatus Beckwithbacteria bacterium RBG_13_42_9 TaxID=1797457 RepID=A0A1F5E4P0_9BACT|nr:MAG: hypothetical protein A2160_00670 [Candidatus Beckwithbacteria bacterium RBG_13_42_9]
MIFSKILQFKTKKYLQFIDLTEIVEKEVKKFGLKNGLLAIYSTHTTVAIRVNESEKGMRHDFRDLMKRLVPKEVYYRHNDLNVRTENLVCDPNASDCLNGHSHCIHLLLGNSEIIPLIEGKLSLGQWQRIFAIELDCARDREIIIQLMGEK